MRRLLVIGSALTGAALVARSLARRVGRFDMAACIEAMPDTSPPKWMFTNVAAIRENTDRILEILGEVSASDQEAPAPADAGVGSDA